jgi:hypothetical protein
MPLEHYEWREMDRTPSVPHGETSAVCESDFAAGYPHIYEALIPLLRTTPDELDAYLETVACNVEIDGTQTHAHCHFIALDGNRRPRVNDFARYIGNKILDFAIPRSEIRRALDECRRNNSTVPVTRLNAKARALFTRLPGSGEGGEVLLSVLTETFLRLPQMFTKMVLKTSPAMHIHGCDGIHVGVNESTGNLTLYWGESKLYGDMTRAVRECFASVAPFLLSMGGSNSPQERDLQLMRDGIDCGDRKLEDAIKRYLNPDDPMFKQLECRGLCLVGFDSDSYPTEPSAKDVRELRLCIEEGFHGRKSHIQRRIIAEKIHTFVIEVFCLPFPSVDDFRRRFRYELGISDEQG